MPEAYGYEVALVFRGGVLNDELGDSLCRAHDTGWAHRLVGGDEHEVLASCLECRIDDVQRSKDVVRDRLDHIFFHQRDVLMRSRVEDGVRLVQLENRRDPLAITDIGDDRRHAHFREIRVQLVQNIKDRVFAVTDQDKARGCEPGDLSAELATNRASGSRDQDGFRGRQLCDCSQIRLHRLTPQ
ncbi:MAG TPA: hypothetical protein VIO16_14640 [Dehalococcoidia bacterium]